MKRVVHVLGFTAVLLLSFVGMRSEAQSSPGGPMTTLVNDARYAANFGAVERSAAAAIDAAANSLNNGPCGDGCASGFDPLYNLIQALQANANSVLFGNGGPGAQVASQEISVALRGVAPEELASQRAASNEFASGQRNQLSQRLSTLRSGGGGFAVNGQPLNLGSRSAIGAASADSNNDFSRLGGFFNYGHTWGKRDATSLEDAFDFRGNDVTLGLDYRVARQFVLGLMLGYTKQDMDFNASNSGTAGGIKAKGLSAQLYASAEWDGPYLSASLGAQRLAQDTKRVISYQLSAPVTTVDVTANGSTKSNALTGFLEAGWSLQHKAWGYEPFLRYAYRKTTINAFRETSIDNSTGTSAGIEFGYNERAAKSSTAAVGFKVQYAATPSFGVVVPFVQVEYRHEFADDALQTQAGFSLLDGAVADPSASAINLSGDRPDTAYYLATLGTSVVFKHGVQGFLQLQSLQGYDHSKVSVATLGIRGEF